MKHLLKNHLWICAATALLMTAVRPANAAETPPAGTREGSIEHGGLTRTYRVHVPSGYDGKKAVPLVLGFHGGGGNAQGAERNLGFNPLADKHGFIAVYPQGIDSHWNDGRVATRFEKVAKVDDVGFIRALIGQLQKEFKIDARRIYSAGLSNGGFISHRLGWELSDLLAAIGPAAGTLSTRFEKEFAPKYPVHVIDIHGTKDGMVPYEGGMVSGQGGLCFGAQKMVAMWALANGCATPPKSETLPKISKDKTVVRRDTYAAGAKGAEVVFYTVEGLGHVWPHRSAAGEDAKAGSGTQEFDAAELVWDFFSKHPKTGGPAATNSSGPPASGE